MGAKAGCATAAGLIGGDSLQLGALVGESSFASHGTGHRGTWWIHGQIPGTESCTLSVHTLEEIEAGCAGWKPIMRLKRDKRGRLSRTWPQIPTGARWIYCRYWRRWAQWGAVVHCKCRRSWIQSFFFVFFFSGSALWGSWFLQCDRMMKKLNRGWESGTKTDGMILEGKNAKELRRKSRIFAPGACKSSRE